MLADDDTGSPVSPGDVLFGKYRVEKVLAAGGMGVVVAVEHIALRERRALKFMLPGTQQSNEGAARFMREARAAVKLRSAHAVKVIDVDAFEDGTPYM